MAPPKTRVVLFAPKNRLGLRFYMTEMKSMCAKPYVEHVATFMELSDIMLVYDLAREKKFDVLLVSQLEDLAPTTLGRLVTVATLSEFGVTILTMLGFNPVKHRPKMLADLCKALLSGRKYKYVERTTRLYHVAGLRDELKPRMTRLRKHYYRSKALRKNSDEQP